MKYATPDIVTELVLSDPVLSRHARRIANAGGAAREKAAKLLQHMPPYTPCGCKVTAKSIEWLFMFISATDRIPSKTS